MDILGIYRDYEAQGLNSCFECTLFVLNEIDRLTQSSFDLLKFYKYIIVWSTVRSFVKLFTLKP